LRYARPCRCEEVAVGIEPYRDVRYLGLVLADFYDGVLHRRLVSGPELPFDGMEEQLHPDGVDEFAYFVGPGLKDGIRQGFGFGRETGVGGQADNDSQGGQNDRDENRHDRSDAGRQIDFHSEPPLRT